MPLPQYKDLIKKDRDELLSKLQRDREAAFKSELDGKVTNFVMGILLGWGDSAMVIDAALGIERKVFLRDALKKAVLELE